MPKSARELTALAVKGLTEPGTHLVGGVPGLALQVAPGGGRSWLLRFSVGQRRREMGLGSYPDVSLAMARERARQARDKLRDGVDPIEATRTAKAATVAANAAVLTFRKAAEQYIEAHRSGWRNAKHVWQWQNSLELYAHPFIGGLNVADIGLPHVLQVLEQPVTIRTKGKGGGRAAKAAQGAGKAAGGVAKGAKLWEVHTETAVRLRGRLESILDWCRGRGHRTGDNPAAWRGNLDALLPKPQRIAKVEHYPAIALGELGQFMAELRSREGVAARALEFVILTAARSGEVRGMTWAEVDFNTGVWTVPAARMKAGKEHRVPLSDAARALLVKPKGAKDSDAVFPAPRGGVMSDMTLTAVMRRMGRREVPHGFRSTFRDWAAERTAFPAELAEMALAHQIPNAVERAYRRGDLMDKRREMMEQWSRFCGMQTPAAGTVVPLKAA